MKTSVRPPSRHILPILLMALMAVRVTAATNDNAVAQALVRAQRDIAQATTDLNQTRDAIAAKRMPLATALETLEQDVVRLRGEADRRRAVQRQGEQERQTLASRVRTLEADANFVFTALREYRRSLETRQGPAVAGPLAARLAEIDKSLSASDDYASLPQAAGALLDLAEESNRAHLGGEIFTGACLDESGREHAGRFVVAGPLAYFVGDGKGPAGIVGRRTGSISPALLAVFADDDAAAVRRVADGADAPILMDVSGGEALRAAEARESLWEHLRSGGIHMIPLAAVAIVAIVLIVSRLIALRRIRMPSLDAINPVVDRLLRNDVTGAQAAATIIGGPAAEILHEGIAHYTAATENLEEVMHERMLGIVPTLDRHLGMIGVLGSAAPLLGLLGTVGGIMHTFRLITIFGSGDARLLSSGIAEALVATQTGLCIAIPIVLIHAYLSRRVRTILAGLEQVMVAFVNRVKPPV